MSHSHSRRAALRACATLSLVPALGACMFGPFDRPGVNHVSRQLALLEARMQGRLGVYAVDTGNGAQVSYRAHERFPMCSTFKVVLAAAVLARSATAPAWLAQRIRYGEAELVKYSPITRQHVADGMRVDQMCGATLQYSDNTAANQLMKLLGGPDAVTAFARSIGDDTFSLARWEPELNAAIPDDVRDTSTPEAMARTLRAVLIGDALAPQQRQLLQRWMLGNRTGDRRIRAGVSKHWRVADKTGTGDYGTVNDIAVLWPPTREPLVLAVYFTQPAQQAQPRDDVIAQASRIVVDALSEAQRDWPACKGCA